MGREPCIVKDATKDAAAHGYWQLLYATDGAECLTLGKVVLLWGRQGRVRQRGGAHCAVL
jgi:hypothetical protein